MSSQADQDPKDINPDLTNLTTAAPAPASAPTSEAMQQPMNPPATTALPLISKTNAEKHVLHPSTLAIHADDTLRRGGVQDIAPPIHVSSTFHYPRDPAELFTVRERRIQQQQQQQQQHMSNEALSNGISDVGAESVSHIYSRESTHNTTRLETLLTALLHGDSVVYSSGLAALHAIYVLLKPSRVAISGGYHGAHAVLALQKRLTGLEIVSLEETSSLGKGDVIHVETPVNPTGEARDLEFYKAKATAVGAFLIVDATFGPPGLQDPFAHGADIVMHSGTKYFGGHSDLLCGVLATRDADWAKQLRDDRTVMGSVMGGLEVWLVIRSLRTLGIRVERASANVGKLVAWLESERLREGSEVSRLVDKVLHASLQPEAQEKGSWLQQQMPNGYGPVFAFVMKEQELARRLPTYLTLFQHATSLGGVESLVEWRAMSDDMVDEGLIRVSVGIEEWTDLRWDLQQAFARAVKEGSKEK